MLAAIAMSMCACGGNAHTVSTASVAVESQSTYAVSDGSGEGASQTATADFGEITEENFMDFPTTDESEFETFSVDGGVYIKYCSSEDPVVVVPETIGGEKVLGMSDGVFFQKDNLIAVSLPDTVEHVGNMIMNCFNLKYINLGSGLKEISNFIVQRSKVMEKIYVPEGVESINSVATCCPELKDIYVPSTATEITGLVTTVDYDCPNAVIHTPKGSAAEQWAIEHDIPVVNDYE